METLLDKIREAKLQELLAAHNALQKHWHGQDWIDGDRESEQRFNDELHRLDDLCESFAPSWLLSDEAIDLWYDCCVGDLDGLSGNPEMKASVAITCAIAELFS